LPISLSQVLEVECLKIGPMRISISEKQQGRRISVFMIDHDLHVFKLVAEAKVASFRDRGEHEAFVYFKRPLTKRS
jgi:hypothetical protein